jgi:hypothetical protein
MTQLEPTRTISVENGDTYNVADLPEDIQRLVALFDSWRADEVAESANLMKTRAALDGIKSTLAASLQSLLTPDQAVPEGSTLSL